MALLRLCLDNAWVKYEATFRPVVPLCSSIGMANILRELVIQEVRERFVGVTGVDVHDNTTGGRFLVDIDRRLLLSFKKLTKNFRTANNPTETSKAFDRQERAKGVAERPRVTVGYQLGHYGTSIAGTWLAFVVGKQCIWHHGLPTDDSSIEIEFPRNEQSAADKEREDAAEKTAAEEKRKKRKEGTDDVAPSDGGDGTKPGG